uniref:Uncharacterized protein n=1 Tax=Melanopsichium pennsylvanicum 4 TaxID=1398559 RepID=A0A077R7V0_9BASI|nr:uncharacterized protein BN887_06191 [Melanopsichium pennsylvanicum 4]
MTGSTGCSWAGWKEPLHKERPNGGREVENWSASSGAKHAEIEKMRRTQRAVKLINVGALLASTFDPAFCQVTRSEWSSSSVGCAASSRDKSML